MNIPFTQHTLENGLRVIIHEDRRLPMVAVNLWYHVGSKNEHPGRTGFAHLFEHLMFEGSQHYDKGYFHPLQEAGRGAEWIDEPRSHQLLGGRSDQRARSRLVDGIGPDGISAARIDGAEVRNAARGRAQRAASELRKPALWPHDHGHPCGVVSLEPSLPLDDDWRDRRSQGRHVRRRHRVFPDLLPSLECVARRCG